MLEVPPLTSGMILAIFPVARSRLEKDVALENPLLESDQGVGENCNENAISMHCHPVAAMC
jgi:hypothetical protein